MMRLMLALFMLLSLTSSRASALAEGQEETIRASGPVRVEQGEFYGGDFEDGEGEITVTATNIGARVTPLEPHDKVNIEARIETNDGVFEVRVSSPLVSDPAGRFTTWWGVGFHVAHHGDSGIGSDKLPTIDSDLAAFGLGDVARNGEIVAVNVPVHVMTADEGLPGALELDVGDPDLSPIPSLPAGHLRVIWSSYEGSVSHTPERTRWLGGGVVLVVALGLLLLANRSLKQQA